MAVLSLAALTGCPATAWEQLQESKDVDELREYILDNPDDPNVGDARQRIAEIEFRRAKAAGTRFAYNSFLERHGNSSYALDVRRLLEDLDFKQAESAGDEASLRAFLNRHPNGHHADQARRLLEKAACRRWLGGSDLEALAAFIAGQPSLSCNDRLRDHLKDLRLKRALETGDTRQLILLVQAHEGDPDLRQARDLLLVRQVEALLRGGQFELARKAAESSADADRLDPLLEKVGRAREAWRCAQFEADPDDPRAQPLPPACRNRPPHSKAFFHALAKAVRMLTASHRTGTPAAGSGSDPLDRWRRAAELARADSESVADHLLDLQADGFIAVRRAAFASLAAVVDNLGPVRKSVWLRSQKKRLTKKAESGVLLLRLALIHRLLGEQPRALTLLHQVIREGEQPDLFALQQAAEIAAALGRQREAASLARQFSAAAQAYAIRRMEAWKERKLSAGDSGWLILRQIYGLTLLWQDLLLPYEISPDGRVPLASFPSVNGPWLAASEEHLGTLKRWFRNEERRWSRLHRAYRECASPVPAPAEDTAAQSRSLLELGLAGGRSALPILIWVDLHHPRAGIRQAAAAVMLGLRTLQVITPGLLFDHGP